MRRRSARVEAVLSYPATTMTRTFSTRELTDAEVIDSAEVITSWTPSIRGASVEDVVAAGRFHLLTARSFLRKYGERLAALSPSLHQCLLGYVA